MFHTVAFKGTTAASANAAVPAVVDDILNVQNNRFFLKTDMEVLFAYVGGATLERARIVEATMRKFTLPFVSPVNQSATIPDVPAISNYTGRTFRLPAREQISLEATNTGSLADAVFGVLGLSESKQPPIDRQIYTMRGTSTDAAVADTWTSIEIDWDNSLPQGTYEIVGGSHISATGAAFRFNVNQQLYRPGGMSSTAVDTNQPQLFRFGNLGRWGVFTNDIPPEVQVLCNAADASHEVYIDFIPMF